MPRLLDPHLCSVRRRDLDGGVGLAEPLDVSVDLRLRLVVPDAPVRLGHHGAVDLERGGGTDYARRQHEHTASNRHTTMSHPLR